MGFEFTGRRRVRGLLLNVSMQQRILMQEDMIGARSSTQTTATSQMIGRVQHDNVTRSSHASSKCNAANSSTVSIDGEVLQRDHGLREYGTSDEHGATSSSVPIVVTLDPEQEATHAEHHESNVHERVLVHTQLRTVHARKKKTHSDENPNTVNHPQNFVAHSFEGETVSSTGVHARLRDHRPRTGRSHGPMMERKAARATAGALLFDHIVDVLHFGRGGRSRGVYEGHVSILMRVPSSVESVQCCEATLMSFANSVVSCRNLLIGGNVSGKGHAWATSCGHILVRWLRLMADDFALMWTHTRRCNFAR